MTSPNDYYDLLKVYNASQFFENGLFFVGESEFPHLFDDTASADIQLDVVFYPTTSNEEGKTVQGGPPRPGRITGKLVTARYTRDKTKGKFVFADGTIVYLDTSVYK